jgi:hypothetical protein
MTKDELEKLLDEIRDLPVDNFAVAGRVASITAQISEEFDRLRSRSEPGAAVTNERFGNLHVIKSDDGSVQFETPRGEDYACLNAEQLRALLAWLSPEPGTELAPDLERAATLENSGHGYTIWRIGGQQFVPLHEADEAVRRARGETKPEPYAEWDRLLRASVPERWKGCTSPVGAVQSYIAELERAAEPRAKAYGPGMTPHTDDCVCAVCGPPPQQFCPHCGKSEPHTHRVPGVPEPVVFPHR